MKLLAILATGLIALWVGSSVAETRREYTVSYVSIDHVYVDAGRADSLLVGDTLAKQVNGAIVARLEVVYTALHSASCKPLEQTAPVVAGDVLVLVSKSVRRAIFPASEPPAIATLPAPPIIPESAAIQSSSVPIRLFGNVSLSVYRWWDNSQADVDFTQTSGRLNLRAENVWREHVTINIRTRGRYDVRNRTYSAGGAVTEWRNRLWTASLTYDDPGSSIGFVVGRFLPHRLSNIGYLDGALINTRLWDQIEAGLLAGRRPDWAFNESLSSLNKYGGYLSYRCDASQAAFFHQAIGIIAEYHDNIPSRTFLAWQGSLRSGATLGIHHSLEIDRNSNWRKDKTGQLVTISNLYIQFWARPGKALRLSVHYDNRQNYWTYEHRSMADSLFDDRVRHGVRGRIEISPFPRTWLGGSIGYRKTDGEPSSTYGYSGSVRRSGIVGYNVGLYLSIFGFNGASENGLGYNIRLQLPAGPLGNTYCAVGGYAYAVEGLGSSRKSTTFDAGTTVDFARGYYIGGSTEWSSGDDIDGLRTLFELGYRF